MRCRGQCGASWAGAHRPWAAPPTRRAASIRSDVLRTHLRGQGAMTTHTIAVLPGDGIGQEVTPEAVRVLRTVGRRAKVEVQFEEALCGGTAIDSTASPLPDASHAL